MTQVLLVTADKARLMDLQAGFEAVGVRIVWKGSGREAIETIAAASVDLVVVDEDLGDMTGLEMVKRLVVANPLIHCALVSSLSAKAYHEAGEGLGILMQLPSPPNQAHVEPLLARLRQIMGHLTDTG